MTWEMTLESDHYVACECALDLGERNTRKLVPSPIELPRELARDCKTVGFFSQNQ